MRKALSATALALLASATTASASPSIWELAATPRLARDHFAWHQAQGLVVLAGKNRAEPLHSTAFLERARQVLDAVDAAHSPDPHVRGLLGRVLEDLTAMGPAEQRDEHLQRSIVILESVVADLRSADAAHDALLSLAIAYAKAGRPHDEIAAYDQLLSLESATDARSTILANQAEAFMVIGNLERAVDGYLQAISAVGDNAMARWGLAVALDRSGDPETAVQQARGALVYDPRAAIITDVTRVFFVPDYDRHWYAALAAMAKAVEEKNLPQASDWWRAAASAWTQYLAAAHPTDRWVSTARLRKAMCDKRAKVGRAGAVRGLPAGHH